MTISERFEGFLANLTLTSNQRADGETKYKGVISCLNRHYYDSSSASENGKLVGSWGKRTEIRPPRDVDAMFVLPSSIYLKYANMSSGVNKQSALLQEVKGVLQKCYSRTTMRGDGQVVVIPFDSYQVELVPAFAYNSQFYICNTNNGGSYKTVDPDAEVAKLAEVDRATSGKVRHLTKMMKRWQEYCNVPLKSFWIEILATDFLGSWEHREKSTYWYDYMVRDFLIYLDGKANKFIFVPGTYEVISIGDAWRSRAQTARDRAKKACSLEPSDPKAAGEEWQKIFGGDIPRD